MDAKEIYASLEKLFPGKVGDLKADVFDPYLSVDPAAIVEVCRFLHNAPGYRFEVLSDLTALDWPKEERFKSFSIFFLLLITTRSVLKSTCLAQMPHLPPCK